MENENMCIEIFSDTIMKKISEKLIRLIVVVMAVTTCVCALGCQSSKYSMSSMCGTFEIRDSVYGRLWHYSVRLNPDSTFSWRYIYDIADLDSDGKWSVQGKYVVLESYFQSFDSFPVNVHQVESLPQRDEVVILCDKYAYNNKGYRMSILMGDDTVAINSDTISLKCKDFPDAINIIIEVIERGGISVLYAKSEDVIIDNPGVYRIDTEGEFLHARPLNYHPTKEKLKILNKDSIHDVFSTNAILKRKISD